MDISIIANPIDVICNNLTCLTHKELVSAIFGSMLTGASAILIYKLTKYFETRINKYDFSIILGHEIKRMIEVTRLNKSTYSNNIPYQRLPTMEIYQGLLHSGNIKYFDSNFQDRLAELYAWFRDWPLNPNVDLAMNILSDLKKMTHKNKVLLFRS